ncbi:hypothetical protein ACFE04_025484 [Oxalis oulophora]
MEVIVSAFDDHMSAVGIPENKIAVLDIPEPAKLEETLLLAWRIWPRPEAALEVLPMHHRMSHESISTEPVIQVASVDNGDDFGQHSSSDGFDSDESQTIESQTIESNRLLLEEFIQKMSIMSYEEVRDRTRQWNCPACHGGPGATRRYSGLRPLLAHANANEKRRMKLHKELAQLLGEELRKWRTPVQRFSAKRKTLGDVEVVWPPMVIIMNTGFRQDVNHGMNGMGNLDLVKHFDAYSPVKSRKCYAPQELYGMNVLIFESSADGYLAAKLLHKQFKTEERGRVHFDPLAGGLYGYLAVTKDLHIFNQTHRGNNKLKYEIRSYRQMVTNQIKQMAKEKKQLQWLKFKFVEEQSRADALAHALDMKNKEMEIVSKRSNSQHQEYHEQLEFLERFYEDQFNQAKDLNIDKNILELGQFNDMKNENED